MTSTQSLLERRGKAVAQGVSNLAPIFAAQAKGALVTDLEGREFLDFVGGIGVLAVGHNHPKVVEAIKAQADKLIHSCFHIVMYEGYVALAEKLISLTPGSFEKRAALFNSGAEAVENAIKIARHATGRQGVIAFENGFHGRTLLAMTLTSKVKPYKFGFGPYAPEVYRTPYPYCYRCPKGLTPDSCGVACANNLREMFVTQVAPENVACLIVEPVTGEGGFVVPPEGYFKAIKSICEEHGIVFIADEVQTGFGRTGEFMAMDHWGVEPDLVVMAKSMGGGMPISAVGGKAELMNAPQIGGLGGTYGGNPVSCAAALAAIGVLEEEGLLERGRELGRTMRARFEEMAERYPIIGDVRGQGPMLALELVESRETKAPATAKTKALVAECQKEGLLLLACGSYGNVVRVLLPLVTTDAELERGLAILDKAFAKIG